MKNFLRVIRLAFRYPATLAGGFACSLLVAVLWGGNIGALYPIFNVVLEGKSLQQWIDSEIAESEAEVAQLEQQIAALEQQAAGAPAEQEALGRQIGTLRSERDVQQADILRKRWLQPLIHRYLPHDPFRTIVAVVAVLMIATVIKDGCIVLNLVLVARLMQLVALDLQRQFHDHVLKMDSRTFGKYGTSNLMTHMGADIAGATAGLNHLFGGAVREPLKMLACMAGAAYICWRLLAFSLLLAPVAVILVRVLAKSIKRSTHRALEESQQLNRVIFEAFTGLQTVQAYTMESHERKQFARKAQACMRKSLKIVFYNALTKPATEVLGIGVVSLALLAGAYLVLNQETELLGIKMCDEPLSLSLLLVFYGLLIGTSDPARKLSEVFSGIQGGAASADRLYPILDTPSEIGDPPQPRRAPKPHQRLVFENVTFAYGNDQPVLRGIDLEIRFGETVAIVGPNGCGKTTLCRLIPRYFDPQSGSVRLNDVDLREMRLKDLRSRIGVVSQQDTIFDETVFNNIRYGSPQATEEQVIEAAKKAHAHGFIVEKLQDGYQTIAGQGGNCLSGGQRQRIALARAILRDPEILILDEATSQIDIESEHLIHKALEQFVRGRTAIMVTHRLSTLALAHRILVMDAGRIIDSGTHDELLARCPVYRRLHEIQMRQSA